MGLKLDDWQKEVLNAKGHICLCSGRQTGKSTIIARRDAEFAVKNANKSILIISSTERQSEELFIKVLNYLEEKYRHLIKRGKERPTKHIIRLHNGSIIRCLPTGLAGIGIRGFTIDRLTADEAAFIPEEVWQAVTPMLLTTGGDIVLLSTPKGKQGYFYECYNSPDFSTFHVNSEEVIKNRPICASWKEKQREGALAHLEREKKKMSSLQYAQEYLGEFIDELQRLFSDKLIKKACTLSRRNLLIPSTYFLGVDVARLGGDQSTFEIVDTRSDNLLHVESIITEKTRLTDTAKEVIRLEKKYKFRQIGIDDRGVGAGVLDMLLSEDETKRKVVGLDNAKRALNRDETKVKSLLKEDMYMNFLALLEQGKLHLLDDDEVRLSLASVQYEYQTGEKKTTQFRIFGEYTHVVEGLIRAVWLAKHKPLNIWVR